jgi:ABC-type Fe3+ transport system substrate-binding protein
LFYDFLLSESGQQLIAKEGRVVAHPKVEPIYPRMKELQALLGTPRVQLRGEEKTSGRASRQISHRLQARVSTTHRRDTNPMNLRSS